MNYFYAYHGPANKYAFDYTVGYGVSKHDKWKIGKTKKGDFVFVIQNTKKNNHDNFALCGLFKIEEYYFDPLSVKCHRFRLSDASKLISPIPIDEMACSALLPIVKGNFSTNFKNHFCRRGVSFQAPLDHAVKKILYNKLLSGLPPIVSVIDIFNKELERASELGDEELDKAAKSSPKLPKKRMVVTEVFERNPYVVEAVLRRAKGHCEGCGRPAPFLRRSNGKPYLEVHHIEPLSAGGEDTIENAVALCPNCHREKHFG